jgi:hypothetical protein
MPEDAFTKHTTREKYIKQGRIKMLNALIEILKNPDEVWLNDHSQKKQDVHFIKYFNGQAIDVVCSLDNLKYAISTWFQIVVSDKTRHLYRRGLLIKK